MTNIVGAFVMAGVVGTVMCMVFMIAVADAALDGNDALEQYYGLLAVLSLAGAFFGFDQAMKEAGITADQLAFAKENAATNTNVDVAHTSAPPTSGGARGTSNGTTHTPNSGQGFSKNGYNPQPGERTMAGYVKDNANPEVSLRTKSAGFNNNNGNIGGVFKRFGAKSHGGISPHVHQPQRNVALNGNIYGSVGSKTANGGVTSPSAKDIKQLYEYLVNGKYH